MAYAALEILADRVRNDLEKHFETRPAQLRRHLVMLLRLLLTAEVPEDLAALSRKIRGLPTHLAKVEAYLKNESHLPEALCARYKYGLSAARSRRYYPVTARVWEYFHALAQEVSWDPALHIPQVAYEKFPWHDALENRFVAVEVVLASDALERMLVCALEAYLSPRRPQRKGYEVYGINLGMTRDVPRQSRRNGAGLTRYVSVAYAQPQLSAAAAFGFVEPNHQSLQAILDATTAMYPQYEAVADFHSHPYDNIERMEFKRGWLYTDADESSNVDTVGMMQGMGHHLRVCFVLAICRSPKRVARRHFRGLKNTLQVSLGNCKVIVAAYRSLESGHMTDTNIRLRLGGMVHG